MFLPSYTTGRMRTADGAELPYLELGTSGPRVVVIPGAGDGLTCVDEGARQLAWYFRRRARRQRLLLLSRRQPVPHGFTVEQHAEDFIRGMEERGWSGALLECNSGGGPIGQWIAVKRPDLVRGLVLSCTLHRTDEHLRSVFHQWMELARQGRWKEFGWSSIEYTFRPETVARYRRMKPLLGLVVRRPRDPERILRVLEGLLTLDNRAILPSIRCPTLVIGGEEDRLIRADIQREMAALIPGARLVLYPGYGHGADQEHPDYVRQVAALLYP